MSFVDVREPHTNKLLFRYDPVRQLIEVQRRGEKTVVDLTQYADYEDVDVTTASDQEHVTMRVPKDWRAPYERRSTVVDR